VRAPVGMGHFVAGRNVHALPWFGMRGDADIAKVGALLAEPARAKILLALADQRALPASILAGEAGVTASTASARLGKLLDGGFLKVERHCYDHLAGMLGAQLMRSLLWRRLLAGGNGSFDPARARADRLFELGWIEQASGNRAVQVTDSGAEGLRVEFGLELGESPSGHPQVHVRT
jgi:DNA-binding transcriptional ArsR family regulator